MKTMEAGRELDALVAEKVMGWKRELTPIGYRWHNYHGHPQANTDKGPDCPPFSTSIAAAWEVVGKMRGEGWTLMLTSPPGTAKACSASFYKYAGDAQLSFGDAPLAISLAALKAVNRRTQ